MIVDNVTIESLTPLCIVAQLDGGKGKVEIIESAQGEAFMRFGDSPVERYTALMEHEDLSNEKVDDNDKLYRFMSDFWEAFYKPEGHQLIVERADSPLGYGQIGLFLFGVLSKVADYPGNLRISGVTVEHTYPSRAVQPSLRKDIKVEWRSKDQPAKADYYFADLMAYLNGLSEPYNCQFLLSQSYGNFTITPKYKGYNDKRHLRMNEDLDRVLGVRHEKA